MRSIRNMGLLRILLVTDAPTMENRLIDVSPSGQRKAAGTQSTLLLSATLVQMGTFVHQLRCGQPLRRSALRVMRYLDCLACCDELEPGLRRELAELADAWTGLMEKPSARSPGRSLTPAGAALEHRPSSAPARAQPDLSAPIRPWLGSAMNSRPQNAASPTGMGHMTETPPPVESRHLLRGKTELRIRHNGEEYRLRVTRQNKLILTK
jgi:hemin uptake protein HemP